VPEVLVAQHKILPVRLEVLVAVPEILTVQPEILPVHPEVLVAVPEILADNIKFHRYTSKF